MYPIKLLAAKYGHHHRLREMLPRFKCQQCGRPPAKVMLCEKPYTDGSGMAGFNPGWKVNLLAALRREKQAGVVIVASSQA